jgi:hypothetical protein
VPFVVIALPRAYQIGRTWAEEATGLLDLSNNDCPWTAEEVLTHGFYPGTLAI